MIRRLLLGFVVTVTCALPALSDEGFKALRSRGDLLGWEAIGRVDLVGRGYCTGSLIAQDLVLTAAHCLFDQNGNRIPTERILFQAGYVSGDALAVRKVNHVVIDESYVSSAGGYIQGKMMRHDLALLRLSSPIFSSEADPFAVHADPQEGEVVSVLSYGKGRSEHLSWQKDCKILTRMHGLMSFDCDVTFGSSGAPVFVRYGTRMRILSVVSAMRQQDNGRTMALGMELPAAVARLKQRMRYGEPSTVKPGNGAKRITVGSGNRAGGAKFIKVN